MLNISSGYRPILSYRHQLYWSHTIIHRLHHSAHCLADTHSPKRLLLWYYVQCTVVNSTLVVDPQSDFAVLIFTDVSGHCWTLFRTGQGHCNACHKKWGFTDNELCGCGEIQTMSHIVNFCPLTKFDGGLLRLHEADEAAVDWLTTYGS